MNAAVFYQYTKRKLLSIYNRTIHKSAAHIGLLCIVSGLLFLINSSSLPLLDPDESRCAIITSEMQKYGDWIVPHFLGVVYEDKPAPFFWLAAAAERLTGNPELAGRLVAALAGLGAVLATYFWARQLFGPAGGLLASLILATSFEFLFIARWYRMDMPFTAGLWAAIWWFSRQQSLLAADNKKIHQNRGWLGFYFFCAIATLFKGPAGLVLPAIIVALYLLLSRQARKITGFFYLPGIAIFLLITAPWYIAVFLRDPHFAYDFFILQNLYRYTGSSFRHHWSVFFYIPALLGGFLPWTVFLPAVVEKYFPFRWSRRADNPSILMLWITIIFITLFFTFSKTKMANYIAPVFPALAVLTGGLISRWLSSKQQDKAVTNASKAFVIAIVVIFLLSISLEIYLNIIDFWIIIFLLLTALAVWHMLRSLRHKLRTRFTTWAFVGITAILLFLFGHTAMTVYDLMSTRVLARLVPADSFKHSELCFFENTEFSFIFYSDIYHFQKFHKSPENLSQLSDLLSSNEQVYCLVTGQDRLDLLKKTCSFPLYTLGRCDIHWLVTNQPPKNSP